jgi:hypothetical protein
MRASAPLGTTVICVLCGFLCFGRIPCTQPAASALQIVAPVEGVLMGTPGYDRATGSSAAEQCAGSVTLSAKYPSAAARRARCRESVRVGAFPELALRSYGDQR